MSQFLFITDLDDTLVGDDAAMAQLNERLSQHRQQHGTKIVYSTGRSPTLYQQLTQEKPLLEPDAVVLGVGTMIFHNGSPEPDATWQARLRQHWDRDRILATVAHFADLELQPESEQNEFKASYFLYETVATEVMTELQTNLQQQGLEVNLVYSGGKHLDILPKAANKGFALAFLQEQWGFERHRTVACGDSGNDLSMFEINRSRGIIVGNAMTELRQWHEANPSSDRYLATQHHAAGVLEGLQYFELL